jgi:hypothetical protein
MTFSVRDLVNTEPSRIQIGEPRDEPAEVLLIDPLCRFPVDRRHIRSILEIHFLTQYADVLLEPYDVKAVFVNKVKPFDTSITTPASYLSLIKDNKALLRFPIKISDRASISVFNRRASLATVRTVTGLTRTAQNSVILHLFSITSQRFIPAELHMFLNMGDSFRRVIFAKREISRCSFTSCSSQSW